MRAGADARIPDTDGAYPGDTFDTAVTVGTQRSVQQLVWGSELFAQRAPALDAAEKAMLLLLLLQLLELSNSTLDPPGAAPAGAGSGEWIPR
jgi:hypothetical protein